MIINNERIYFPRRFKQSNHLKRSSELHEYKVNLIVRLGLQKSPDEAQLRFIIATLSQFELDHSFY